MVISFKQFARYPSFYVLGAYAAWVKALSRNFGAVLLKKMSVTVSLLFMWFVVRELFVRSRTRVQFQICPGLNANEMHALYNKHHKVSSLLKVHLNTYNSVKYEVV